MASRSRKKDEDQTQEQETTTKRGRGGRGRTEQDEQQAQQTQGEQASNGEEPRALEPTEVFDPVRATRLATLRLARSWRYGGSTYAAIHAYERILQRYGGTPAARAAAEELLSMADELQRDGKFYTALNIFRKIETYCEPAREGSYGTRRTANVRPV